MIFFIFLLLYFSNLSNSTIRNKLINDIYLNDVINVIPDNGINISLSLVIRAFNNIDQIDGSIEMNIWLRYEWNNDNIYWNSSKYNNLSIVNLNTNPDLDKSIWTPDIYLYNTAEKPMEGLDFTKANVYNNGQIFWSRPGLVKSTCVFDLTYYPFDKQECKLKFGSWSYDSLLISFKNTKNLIDVSNYQEHEEWSLIDYRSKINNVKYDCCVNGYEDIEFHYTILRKPNYYQLNIIIPTFSTATLVILTLLIPWNSGERISFSVTVLLSIIVFLLIVSENLPKSENKPLLSRMIIGLIYFSLIGVAFTIIISSVHNSIENNNILKNKFLLKLFSKCNYFKCCINKKINRYNRSNSYNEAITNNESNLQINIEECKTLTYNIEILFTILFLLSFIIYCLVIFLNIPKYG